MIDGARGSGELEAAFVALVEFTIRAGFARFLTGLTLGSDPSYPQGFTGKALDSIGPAHML